MKWANLALPLIFVAAWIILQALILPKMGVST